MHLHQFKQPLHTLQELINYQTYLASLLIEAMSPLVLLYTVFNSYSSFTRYTYIQYNIVENQSKFFHVQHGLINGS